jgi:hypothetical protein
LAGTWKQYSKKASPQLNNTISQRAAWCPFLPKNLRCPYQAMVIKAFDRNSKPIVERYFAINSYIVLQFYAIPVPESK